MTTDIRIRTNGQYITKGTLTINPPGGPTRTETVEVGPSTPGGDAVEKSYHVPHGAAVTFDLQEKHADEWAQEAVEGEAGTTEGEQEAAQGEDVGRDIG